MITEEHKKQYQAAVVQALRARYATDPRVNLGSRLKFAITIDGKQHTFHHIVQDSDFADAEIVRPTPTINEVLAYNADIGLMATARAKYTCNHATVFCLATCYNNKLYGPFGQGMAARDVLSEEVWNSITGDDFAAAIDGATRVRLATRGEIFNNLNDVARVESILKACPNTEIWIPTRAWRNPTLKKAIEQLRSKYANLRVLASIDPSNTESEYRDLVNSGWSTMFYWDDNATPQHNPIRCEKTWNHTNGACATCEKGCFTPYRVDVWLKQH